MPYFVLKGILRISNPMAMIRGAFLRLPVRKVLLVYLCCFSPGVLELFLARPFGGQSLIQRSVLLLPSSSASADPFSCLTDL